MSTTSEQGIAEINGAQIAYEVAGTGPPLTLIHAGIADKRMWEAQFATFAESYRVVRYDIRGYGQSTCPAGPYTMRADLRALLQHLGIARTHLLGISMGGSIAIDFTLDYPEMVSALIPVAAGISGEEGAPNPELEARWGEIDEASKRGDIDAANELELRIWVDGFGRTAGPVDPTVREKVRVMNAAALAREGEFEQAESVNRLDPPAIGRLAEIAIPTLVIVGACDLPEVVASAEVLATRIPGAQKVVLPEVAHLPPLERPAEFNRLVLDFLRRC
jgi:3-oxoadipate enol-lactonase